RQSCELCRIPQTVPDAEITRFAEHLIEQNMCWLDANDEVVVVLFAMPGEFGPNLCITTEVLHGAHYRRILESGAKLMIPAVRHVPEECIPRSAKMRSRMFWWIAEQQAHDVDPDASALLLDLAGNVTETASANFLIVDNGTVVSPPQTGVLDGI